MAYKKIKKKKKHTHTHIIRWKKVYYKHFLPYQEPTNYPSQVVDYHIKQGYTKDLNII